MSKNAKKWFKVVESGIKILMFVLEEKATTTSMTFFTSEYESKLDSKGRIVLPDR